MTYIQDVSTTFRLMLCVLIRIPKSFTESFEENSPVYKPFTSFPEWFLHYLLQLLSSVSDPVLIELTTSFLFALRDAEDPLEFTFLDGFDKIISETQRIHCYIYYNDSY